MLIYNLPVSNPICPHLARRQLLIVPVIKINAAALVRAFTAPFSDRVQLEPRSESLDEYSVREEKQKALRFGLEFTFALKLSQSKFNHNLCCSTI